MSEPSPRRAAVDYSALLGTLAHDLRTPLATVYGFAKTLERQGLVEPAGKRFLSLILESAEELDREVELVALIGRLTGGRLVPAIADVPVATLLEAAADVAPPRADGRRVVIGGAEGPPVATDRSLAALALALLADAALRLDPARRTATLSASGGRLLVDGFDEQGRAAVLAAARDVPLVAARVVLDALGATLTPREDGILEVGLDWVYRRETMGDEEEGGR